MRFFPWSHVLSPVKLAVHIGILMIVTCSIPACRNGSRPLSRQEMELKEREIALREKELALRELELETLRAQLNKNNRSHTLAEIYMDVKRAVYLVSTTKEYGTSQGSAFVVHPSGLAVSNYHVFENASDVIVYNDCEEQYLVTEILEFSEEQDFILFRIGPNAGDLPYVRLAGALPEVGSECFTVGNPKGLTQSLSDGVVSAFREEQRLLQTTTEITHGSSGGPLFNELGEVIGITSGGFRRSNLNFAINIQSLPLEKYLESPAERSADMSEYEILTLLRNYYDHLLNGRIDHLGSSYNDNLGRFHKTFNINKYRAISHHMDFFRKYEIERADIRDQTIDIQFNGRDYFVTYELDWHLKRKSDGSPQRYLLQSVVEINPNGCISSIYDNILRKSTPDNPKL